MYQVLIVSPIAYNVRFLKALPVWNQKSDFEVAGEAENGTDALNQLRTHSFQMVITEINLGEMDGLQLLRCIKQENLCPIVVILSDTVEFRYVRECIIFGAFDYLKKMPERDEMFDMLVRARESLVSLDIYQTPADEEDYPSEEEAKILRSFSGYQEDSYQKLVENAFSTIYAVNREQPIINDMIAKKLFHNVINKIFTEYPWMHEYVKIDECKEIDYLETTSSDCYKDFFVRRLVKLFERFHSLRPYTTDRTLNTLLDYILSHPEEDLKLKALSEKFYMNYSYLSSSFSSKLNEKYTNYINMVKMEKAAYLLEYTEMKIYEVCRLLSFQDVNYFTRQFQKYYGKSPREYRRDQQWVEDYSYL